MDMFEVCGVGTEAISAVFSDWLTDMSVLFGSTSPSLSSAAVMVEVEEQLLPMLLSLLSMLLSSSGLDSISAVLFAGVDCHCCRGEIDLLLFSCSCLCLLAALSFKRA